MDPDGPNKFNPEHHQPFPNQPINPDPEGGQFSEKVAPGAFSRAHSRISQAEIDRRLDLHSPATPEVKAHLDAIRAEYKVLYQNVVGYTEGAPREQAIALHHLEDALQATIAAIVRPRI